MSLRPGIACRILALCLLGLATPLRAQDATGDTQALRQSLVSLVKALLDQGQLSVAKARELLRQAGVDPAVLEAPDARLPATPPPAAAPAAPPAPAADAVVRVPYVPESLKRDITDEVRKDVIATARSERWGLPEGNPGWAQRISLRGDVRLRLQRDDFDDGNAPPALLDTYYQSLGVTGQPQTRNTTVDRLRLRWRGRLAIGATLHPELRANLRLVTSAGGDANDPTSLNADAGQSSRRLGVAFDQLNLSWNRDAWVVTGGRIANPYQTSDLLWSNDLALDGIAASWLPALTPQLSAFAVIGAHPVREINNSPLARTPDAWLVGLQGGASWRASARWSLRGALGLFDFRRLEARINPAGLGDGSSTDFNEAAPQVRQRGNTMFNITAESNPNAAAVWGLASKFRVIDLNGALDLALAQGWRLGAQVDLLRNIGYDAGEIRQRIGAAAAALPGDRSCEAGTARLDCERSKGYRLELSIGQGEADDEGSWRAFAGTRRLERDAVFDGWASGDYRLGGTDSQAAFLGGSWVWQRNVQLAARYVSARAIDAPLAVPLRVNTLTVDLSARF